MNKGFLMLLMISLFQKQPTHFANSQKAVLMNKLGHASEHFKLN